VTLKHKDINGEFLVFERAKTGKTLKSDPKPITVYINFNSDGGKIEDQGCKKNIGLLGE